MVLSDRGIRTAIEAGRITLDPFDEALIQPASIDVRCDRRFRVFKNSRYGHIDVKQEQAELTELIEITDGGLHRPRLRWPRHARAGQRREPADHALPRHEDRPDVVHEPRSARREAVWLGCARVEVPGPGRPHAKRVLEKLPVTEIGVARVASEWYLRATAERRWSVLNSNCTASGGRRT